MPKRCTSPQKSDCGAFADAGVVGSIWGGAVARAGVSEGAIARADVSEGAIVVAGVSEGAIARADVSEGAIAVVLKYLAISMLAQLTGIKIAPVSCANALSINILSATLPGKVTALTGQSPALSAKAPLHRPSHRSNRPKPRPIGQDTALTGQDTAPSAPTLALTGRGTNFVYFGTGSVYETDSQKVAAEGSWSHRKE